MAKLFGAIFRAIQVIAFSVLGLLVFSVVYIAVYHNEDNSSKTSRSRTETSSVRSNAPDYNAPSSIPKELHTEYEQIILVEEELDNVLRMIDEEQVFRNEIEQKLQEYQSIYDPLSPNRNSVFVEDHCPDKMAYIQYEKSKTNLTTSDKTLEFVFRARDEIIKGHYDWAVYYKSQVDNAVKWKREEEVKKFTPKLNESKNAYDFFSTTIIVAKMISDIRAEALLEEKSRLEEKLYIAKSDYTEAEDALTFGVLTAGKVDRIHDGMSIESVEKILGPGSLMSTTNMDVDTDGISDSIQNYEWRCDNDSGVFTGSFLNGALYLQTITWK